MEQSDSQLIDQFSPYLFWDTDRKKLNMQEHASYIIKNVLEYGQLADWILIRDYYTIPFIAQEATQWRELDKKAYSFISLISHTPREKFRCYTTQQSTPPHWNF